MQEEELLQLAKLEEILKIKFKDLSLLKKSLIHRSYINEQKKHERIHNERLEFLGDAVLELIVSEHLFKTYPSRPEGELTSFRAALVRSETLAETSAELHYGEFLYMSKGEEKTGGRTRRYILGNTYESVLGAIYVDQGFQVAKDFVHRTLIPKLENIVANRLDIDPKSRLQEKAQEEINATPSYEMVSAEGPDHEKIFTMNVVIKGKAIGEGKGHNKQTAEQNAAKAALENWGEIKQLFK